MKRRVFVASLMGAATWPLRVGAQPPDRPKRVAMVLANAPDDRDGQARVAAFRRALRELGWTEGRGVRIDYRWSAGAPDRAQAYATELVASAPDVIVANGTPALAALFQATRSIPIVFVVVVDPVGAGYVESLARPGGNVTGFSTFEPEMGGKWLELLKEIRPSLRRVAVVSNPAFKGFAALGEAIRSTGSRMGLAVTNVTFSKPGDDIDAALAAFAHDPDAGAIVLPTSVNNLHRDRIIALAARHRLPTVYPFRFYATDGGLMCYGFDSSDLFRRSASYVDRILRGARPADLPVQSPTKFELILNLRAARAQGLSVPPGLLARASEVIE